MPTYALINKDVSGLYSHFTQVPAGNVTTVGQTSTVYGLVSIGDTFGTKTYVLRQNVNDWERIGDLLPEDCGVFIDSSLPAIGELIPSDAFDKFLEPVAYPNAMRWSQPNRPVSTKPDAIEYVEDGDGDEIMALANVQGNLIVFKKNSLHRFVTQGNDQNPDIPISRRDKVVAGIGCIAPRSVAEYNGIVGFLSWSGWMKFNGNACEPLDSAFKDELQDIIAETEQRYTQAYSYSAFSCYDPNYNELRLSIQTEVNKSKVFIVSADKGYATKLSTNTNGFVQRIYCVNSYGELRSADTYAQPVGGVPWAWRIWGYIESPQYVFSDTLLRTNNTQDIREIKWLIQTKLFGGTEKNLFMRLRKLALNLYSPYDYLISVLGVPLDYNGSLDDIPIDLEAGNPDYTAAYSVFATTVSGSTVGSPKANTVEIVPFTDGYNSDWDALWASDITSRVQEKPLKYVVRIKSSNSAGPSETESTERQASLHSISLHWKPINEWLS